ncbi:hypothetical protein MUP38_04855 [Candidatus Bathyarchaeota archaeon]|nr:hypothetical protein [Candidatus Bathyarchaeota archaeon]
MAKRRSFNKNYLQQEFDKVASKINQPITLFLIGGGAMAFYGLKDATKDIDIIVANQEKLKTLTTALKSLNYKNPDSAVITRAYSKMQANEILENADGFRWDIFVKKVCNALTFSETMKTRAHDVWAKGKLKIQIASKEDIFLFKGITEREADLDDMRLLAESGLDWKTIKQECQNQTTLSGILWESALYQNLLDLKEKYHIESPIEKPLRDAAEKKLIEITLTKEIEKGNNTVKSITQKIKEPQSFVRTELKRLAKKGLITIDKSNKPYKFYINKNLHKTDNATN